ncbi:MAG: DUF1844 domain-containing protein [Mariniblastus sp.]
MSDDIQPENTQSETEAADVAPSTEESANAPTESSPVDANGGNPQLPPATFMVLLSTLATQAMSCLGFIPDPMTGKPNVNRPMAKHFIDMLAMLQEKTQNNLSEEEANHLRDALHQLRMTFVSTENAGAPDTPEEPKSSIVLP